MSFEWGDTRGVLAGSAWVTVTPERRRLTVTHSLSTALVGSDERPLECVTVFVVHRREANRAIVVGPN